MKLTNAERYLALMRLAAKHGSIEIEWADYSDPGERPDLAWSVTAVASCRVLGSGRSMDEAVDEAASRD